MNVFRASMRAPPGRVEEAHIDLCRGLPNNEKLVPVPFHAAPSGTVRQGVP
jgi:hypothetical protein